MPKKILMLLYLLFSNEKTRIQYRFSFYERLNKQRPAISLAFVSLESVHQG